ncbi:MAG TPA: peptidylprolyl isomerase [Verrucomicrobiae bacterium]
MKIKMKLVFPAALAAIVLGAFSAQAVTVGASTNATPSSADTNSNPAATMAALFGDPVLARGKGFEIKRSDLDEVMLGIKSAIVARGETVSPQQISGIEVTMLNRLIQIQLLLQKATDADKADGKKKADVQLATLLEHAGSQEILDRQLKAVGMTADDLRVKITQEAVATAALTRELGVVVTAAEGKQYFDDHPADFEQPETAHARHILLMTMDPLTRAPLSDEQQKAKRKQIEDLLKRVKSGEDFATLARQYSEDPGSKDNGGELPPFQRGQMVPEFEAAAFSMNTNTISDVVTTAYGYHIIKLLDKTPAKRLALTDKVPANDMTVADWIKERLTQQKVEKLAPEYLTGLKKAAGIEILDPGLKAAAAAAEANAATNMPAATP